MKKWNELIAQFSSPIERLEKYMKKAGLYDEERTKKLRADAKKSVRDSLKAASNMRLPAIDELFNDVYEELPSHLIEQ